VDEDFAGVVAGCADPDREGAWITDAMVAAYSDLHRLGWAHSIEVWDSDDALVGGLYGVSIGGLFAGESMFHRVNDASKVALVHLVVLMNQAGGELVDVQWLTPHLEMMGAVVIGRQAYLARLPAALGAHGPFNGQPQDVPV
jgi:leucyl/phenylalanyl-tRNA--protein transferase